MFAGLPLTQRVAERQCGVYLLDIEAGTIVGYLHFIGDVQEIFDVKLLPHRAPTLVEADSPLLASSYELPDEALKLVAASDPIQDALAAATRAHARGDFDRAIQAYQNILLERPEHRQARHQLGLVLVDSEQWQLAREVLQQVIEEQPDNAEALNSLGLCLSRLFDYQAALQLFERAIEVDQQFALAHFNRGLILLKLQRYAEGWAEYAWRWQLPNFTPFRCPQPQWRGEDISERRLLVHSEQGNGDHLQFWRYLPLLRQRCKELIYVGPDKLAELAASVPGVDESRVPGDIPRDRFDVFLPLMEAPLTLGLAEPLQISEPYVKALPHVQVRQLAGGRKVGLVWQGSPTHKDDHRRSLALTALLKAISGLDANLYSLQFPISGAELELLRQHGVENLEPEIHGYARTAAFVDQLDVLVCVDTAIAHLAGAMGKPVALLLAKDADWRWGLESDRTPWYPTMRLLRQDQAGDWSGALTRLPSTLNKMLSSH